MSFERRLHTIPHRLRSLFRREAAERDLDDELSGHLEQKTQLYIAQGLSTEDARCSALRDIDGLELHKERCRDARRVRPIEDLVQDLRYALRALRKSPSFAATAILTLALGIGANAAIFSVVNAVLLRSLPYPDSAQILTLAQNESLPDLEDIRQQARSFSVSGVTRQALDFTGAGEPVQISGGLCTADLFRVLGVQPSIGRPFTPEEDHFGGPALVLLTYSFWARYFGSDPAVVGKSIRLSGNSYTILGVMPRDFWLPGSPVDVLIPLRVGNGVAAQFRGVHFMKSYLRLKPGVSIQQASAEMKGIDGWLESHYPVYDRDSHRRLIALREAVVGDVRLELLVVFVAVGVVLLIACVNFASLQLARSATRRREIAIRAVLGAPVSRLVRQIVTESVLLSIFGGAIGLGLGVVGIRFLLLLKPADLPRIETTSIDASVLTFTFALSLFTGLLFGLIPAFGAVFSGSNAHLKEDARSSSGGASSFRLRRLLVVSEIALALILLISATLLLRSFSLLHRVDPGFRPENLLTMRLELPAARYEEQSKQRALHRQLLDRLNATPGLHAALISELPMSGDWLSHNFQIDGRPKPPAGSEPQVQTRTIEGDYFRLMGIPLLAGRDFGPEDRTGSLHVAIVNRTFAEKYFQSQDPIRSRVEWARENPPDWMTIIGVVGDVKHFGPNEPEEPAIYDLYSQTKQQWKRWMYIVLRDDAHSDAASGSLLSFAKEELRAIDDQLPVSHVSTMPDVLAASLDHQRFNLSLLGVFAGVALALAVIGIYGVMAYSVTQRTGEIGIRVALGAQQRDILRLILRQGIRLAVVGAAIGVLASLALTRFLSHLLFSISPRDPDTFLLMPLALCAVSLLACYIPARRAVRADPIRALRYE
jgi:putative ABC transport system permease protein